MVHDLKGPVRIAHQCLALLKDDAGQQDEGPLREAAMKALRVLDARVEAILCYGQVCSAPIKRERVDMERLAQKVALQVMQANGGPVFVHVGTLPPCTGEPVLLEHALYNLIDNAAKYGGPGVVSVRGYREGDQITYYVEDHGPGVPDRLAKQIFEPFARGPASLDVPGHGLGLAIVKRVVEAHGGQVSMGRDQGAVFKISLPAEMSASAA